MAGRRSGSVLAAAAAGVASVVLGAGIGELIAALIAPTASPFAAIGGALIDAAPPWAKDAAIGLFGTNDKVALLVGIAVALLAVAAAAGLLERRLPPTGRIIAGLMGVAGIAAATTRADASGLSWLPSAAAGAAAVLTLGALMRRMPESSGILPIASTTTTGTPRAAAPSATRRVGPPVPAGALPTTPAPPAIPSGTPPAAPLGTVITTGNPHPATTPGPIPAEPPTPPTSAVAEAPGTVIAAGNPPPVTTSDTSASGPVPATPPASPTLPTPAEAEAPPRTVGRRRFLAWTVAATALGIVAATGSALLQTGARAATSARRALHLPAPTVRATQIPATASFPLPGLTPLVTPNAAFYRVDTALVPPEIDPATWSLRIHGLVAHEVTLTWEQLLALPLEESYTTLTCVSNEVGGDLIGNAKWLGYPVRHLLARALPRADADMVLSRSADGFTASTPLETLTDGRNAILAVAMNGAPLPLVHGFPVRMVVPGLYGYVSATKWVTDLEVTRFDRATAYWTTRGWSARGPVKLESRIDVPRGDRSVTPGETVIAGVAWQQHIGVSRVEVSIDEGPWREATLASATSDDTWVQWRMPWTATAGDHVIRARATSTTGQVQTGVQAPPAPDGATGWPELHVHVG